MGELPFGDDHSPDTLSRLRTCNRAELVMRLEERGILPWLSAIILACLHANPEDRFPSALALADALEDELRTHSLSDTEIRRGLATHSKVVKDRLGNDDIVDPREFGEDPLSARGRGAMVAAAAILASATAAFFAVSAWQRGAEEPAAARGSLAPTADLETEVSRPATERPPPKKQTASDVSTAPAVDEMAAESAEESVDTDGEEAPPKRRRPKKRKKAATPVLKENPYTD
jgi:hypothetical protein